MSDIRLVHGARFTTVLL